MNPHNLRAFHAYFKFFLHQQNKYQSYLLVLTESTQQVHLAAQELQNNALKNISNLHSHKWSQVEEGLIW